MPLQVASLSLLAIHRNNEAFRVFNFSFLMYSNRQTYGGYLMESSGYPAYRFKGNA